MIFKGLILFFKPHAGTDEQTLQLIQLRIENEHLFTGHRNASVNGFEYAA